MGGVVARRCRCSLVPLGRRLNGHRELGFGPHRFDRRPINTGAGSRIPGSTGLHSHDRSEPVDVELAVQVGHSRFLERAFVAVTGVGHEQINGADVSC